MEKVSTTLGKTRVDRRQAQGGDSMKDHGSRMFPYRLTCKDHVSWHMSSYDAQRYGRLQGFTGCTVEKLCDDGEYRGVA